MSDLLNQASLVMIPSGYKEDTVFSQLPQDGSGDLSFTRASNGTRVNSAGLVEVCPWNLVTYSEEFNNAIWTKNRSSISANSTTAPNGTITADSLIEDTANGTHEFITVLAAQLQSYNFSIYAKANTRSKIQLVLAGTPWATGGNGEASFDLSLGTVISAVNGATGTIESVGNGWYRCTIAKPTSVADPSGVLAVRLLDASGNSIYTGNGTSSAYFYGAQLNIGATAKPYFPTTDRLNVPRLTYQNGGGGCPSLLLEKQSTNLALYSEDFTNAAWGKTNASVTANQLVSPDGYANADLLQSLSSTEPRIRQTTTQTGGAAFTFSCFAKKGNVNFVILRNIAVNSAGGSRAWFNLDTGVVGTVNAGLTASMVSYGNGWYRCIITGTTDAVPTNLVDISLSATDNSISGSAIGSNIYLYGAQLEASSYPTSYIPTTSSSATRVADACFKTGISSLIGQNEGVLFIDFNYNQPTSDANGRLLQVYGTSDVTDSILPLIQGVGATANQFQLTTYSGGSLLVAIPPSASTLVPFGRQKFAIAYNAGAYTVYRNGSLFASGTGASPSSLTALELGSTTFATRNLSNPINQAILFPTRLTNAELAQLTA